MDNTKSWFQEVCLDWKCYVLHRIYNDGAYGNGSLESFKIYWSFVGLGDSLDGQLKHLSKLIFMDIYFNSFKD